MTDELDRPLNRISTLWTVVCQAHDGPADAVSTAQGLLLQRYTRAVYSYLLGALHNREAADDLAQEFALRFIQGRLRGAQPTRGRFRDFVKGVLSNLVADYYRQRRGIPLSEIGLDPAVSEEAQTDFVTAWREETLARAWNALAELEGRTGQPFHTVLRFRADQPELASEPLAAQLSARLGRPLTAAGVRQSLHRARERFADLLLDEVAQTLQAPTAETLAEELGDLGLLDYCRPALDRFRGLA
jgi:RNA polymerase sigma-70 factor (ECF subfamily)